MKRRLVIALAAFAGVIAAQQSNPEEGKAPIASLPVVKIEGKIEKVHSVPQQGMPYLEVVHQDKRSKVILGSMRYLMEQNFNPKAGDAIVVEGYQNGDQVIASMVQLPAAKQTLKLRDENGRPLWRGGARGGNKAQKNIS